MLLFTYTYLPFIPIFYDLIQLTDWFYGLKHSEITQKKIEQFYFD